MRGSLRLRLALWCGGIVCSVVILVALYGYAVHSRTHYDELDSFLQSVTGNVASELARPANVDDRAHIVASARGLGIGVALYDSAGRMLSASATAAPGLPLVSPGSVIAGPPRAPYGPIAALAPAVHHVVRAPGSFGLIENGSERWRVYVLPVDAAVRPDGRVARYVVGTASLSELDKSLRRVWRFMLLIAVVGNIITIATGWLLAGRALRPVLVLTEAARTIARSGAFAQRVPADMPRDELGRLAETFNEMLERLERSHAAQARFVSDASHELRAPLSVIQANLELLAHQSAMSTTEREAAVHEAHTEAARLGRLVADLLVLARADAGVPVRHDPVDLDRVVVDVLDEARLIAPHRRISIGTLDPAVVTGDADRIKQLVLNLVENALKYTPADGRITVAIRRAGAFAEIEVRDTGIGIPAADLPHVFERFYRADPARTRDEGGTGLGLSIALWIARQHDGEIVLASEPGRGTVATVRLPVRT
ncbi:MAG: HAMP domain-containing histidine kinase [Gemmatimonadota bacterium]|nr:HAMP domain-containing histidine kinase [Gemmatimonadota bacterium]